MNERVRQKEATRASILQASLEEFSEKGFDGTSTRLIAAKAGVHHALIKYHFQTKDALWREAVTFLFERQIQELNTDAPRRSTSPSARDYAKAVIRQRVHYWARHPEHARLMVQESCRDTERFRWMVDTFILQTTKFARDFITYLQKEELLPEASVPALVYIFVGGAQLFYTLAPEVRRVWGIDPADPAVIDAHVDALTAVLLR